MAQKSNPISLRIASSTRVFDQAWYSEYFYSQLISKDVTISKYIQNFLRLLKLPQARIGIFHLSKTTKLYTFFCYPKQSREYKSNIFQIPSGLPDVYLQTSKKNTACIRNVLGDSGLFHMFQTYHTRKTTHGVEIPPSMHPRSIRVPSPTHCMNNIVPPTYKNVFFSTGQEQSDFDQLIHLQPIGERIQKEQIVSVFSQILKKFHAIQIPHRSLGDRSVLKYNSQIQNHLSTQFHCHTDVVPILSAHEWQDAGFIADEIVFLLERRISFRHTKPRILTYIKKIQSIQGIRITCSGRVGGKSKKSQRAKSESLQYGQTSLHVFSSKIDFAVRTAHTPLGSTGVKVWVCYK